MCLLIVQLLSLFILIYIFSLRTLEAPPTGYFRVLSFTFPF